MQELPGYRIEKQIGTGGMAKVYLAVHEGLQRKVAIKVMSPHLAEQDAGFSERFIREAQIVANLTHRNIVTVYDVGRYEAYHYIAMEYLPGGITLTRKIEQSLDIGAGLTTVIQIAAALGHAHTKGVVHRDIKPDNILYREDGSAVITDFGVARLTTSAAKMTATGTVIGTPHYMSPEQAQGHDTGAWSDIYSLGAVLYEILTGSVPYDADSTVAVMFKHVNEPVPQLPDELAGYQPILDKMMAKSPKRRYQSCGQIIADLEQVSGSSSPAAEPTRIRPASAVQSSTDATRIAPPRRGATPHGNDARPASPVFIPPKGLRSKKVKSLIAASGSLLIAAVVTGVFLYDPARQTPPPETQPAHKPKPTAFTPPQQQTETARNTGYESPETETQKAPPVMVTNTAPKTPPETTAPTNTQQTGQTPAPPEQDKPDAERADQLALQEARRKEEQARKARTEARKKRIRDTLAKADRHLLNAELDRAHQSYTAVLNLDSDNRAATKGINRVADRYLTLATREALKSDFNKADEYLDDAARIAPRHQNLEATQRQIIELKSQHQAEQAEAEKQKQEEESRRRPFGGF